MPLSPTISRRDRWIRFSAPIVIGLLLCIAIASAALAAQQHQQEAQNINPPTASSQTTILITTVAGFLSLLATQFFSMWRENQRERAKRDEAERQRKWDLEDRRAARVEMRQHAETQRLETIQTAIELAKVSNINRQQLVGEIKANTKLTEEAAAKAADAYVAANNFNEKLERLHQELLKKGHLIEDIDTTGKDTNTKVTELIADKKEA